MHSSPSITRTKVELKHGDEDSCVDQVVMHTLLGRHDILESGLYTHSHMSSCMAAFSSMNCAKVTRPALCNVYRFL